MGNNLKELCKRSGLKQAALGKMVGVSQGVVSEWQNGNIYPSAEKLIELSKVLNVTVGTILGTEPIPEGYPLYTTPTTFAEVLENQKKYVPKFDSEPTPEPKEEKPPFTKAQLDYLDRHLEEVVSRIREKEGFK